MGMWADRTFDVLSKLTLILSLVLADPHKNLVTDTVDNFVEGYLRTYPNITVADVSQCALKLRRERCRGSLLDNSGLSLNVVTELIASVSLVFGPLPTRAMLQSGFSG